MKTKDPLVIGVDHVKELIDFSVNNLSKYFKFYNLEIFIIILKMAQFKLYNLMEGWDISNKLHTKLSMLEQL